MPLPKSIVFFLLCLSVFSCSDTNTPPFFDKNENFRKIQNVTKDSIFSNDIVFYTDSIFIRNKKLIKTIIEKWYNDSCPPILYSKNNFGASKEGFKDLGDINGDNKSDSVFILEPLSFCEHDYGQCYYFTDLSLPRLESNTFCCHINNFFKIDDINEDGINEVGFYYSSCTSRYKSLRIYSLKNKIWEQIADSDFDIMTQSPENIDFSKLVRKITKNKLQIKNFIEGQKYWDTIFLK